MTETQLNRWRKTRALGQPRFVAGRGLICGLIAAGVGLVLAPSPLLHVPGDNYFVAALVGGVGLLAGSIIGVLTWDQNERALRASQSCPSCGYSLTGNTSGRCPECGRQSQAMDHCR